jgi:hypothetical protein
MQRKFRLYKFGKAPKAAGCLAQCKRANKRLSKQFFSRHLVALKLLIKNQF